VGKYRPHHEDGEIFLELEPRHGEKRRDDACSSREKIEFLYIIVAQCNDNNNLNEPRSATRGAFGPERARNESRNRIARGKRGKRGGKMVKDAACK